MNRRMGVIHEVLANLRKEVAGVSDNVPEALVPLATNSRGVGAEPTPNVLTDGEISSISDMLRDSDKDMNMVDSECGAAGDEVGSGRHVVCDERLKCPARCTESSASMGDVGCGMSTGSGEVERHDLRGTQDCSDGDEEANLKGVVEQGRRNVIVVGGASGGDSQVFVDVITSGAVVARSRGAGQEVCGELGDEKEKGVVSCPGRSVDCVPSTSDSCVRANMEERQCAGVVGGVKDGGMQPEEVLERGEMNDGEILDRREKVSEESESKNDGKREAGDEAKGKVKRGKGEQKKKRRGKDREKKEKGCEKKREEEIEAERKRKEEEEERREKKRREEEEREMKRESLRKAKEERDRREKKEREERRAKREEDEKEKGREKRKLNDDEDVRAEKKEEKKKELKGIVDEEEAHGERKRGEEGKDEKSRDKATDELHGRERREDELILHANEEEDEDGTMSSGSSGSECGTSSGSESDDQLEKSETKNVDDGGDAQKEKEKVKREEKEKERKEYLKKRDSDRAGSKRKYRSTGKTVSDGKGGSVGGVGDEGRRDEGRGDEGRRDRSDEGVDRGCRRSASGSLERGAGGKRYRSNDRRRETSDERRYGRGGGRGNRQSGSSGDYKTRNFNMNIINGNSGPLAKRPGFMSPTYVANVHPSVYPANARGGEYPGVSSHGAWRLPLPEYPRRYDPAVHPYGDPMPSTSRGYPSTNQYGVLPDVVDNYYGRK